MRWYRHDFVRWEQHEIAGVGQLRKPVHVVLMTLRAVNAYVAVLLVYLQESAKTKKGLK